MAGFGRVRWVGRWLIGLVLVGMWTIGAAGQAPDASVTVALRSLASRSGVVFEGRVTQVRHVGQVVEVSFSVDQSLLGEAGPEYTLREWAGLWAAGQERYVVGEHVVMFLHAPGKSGLSSPVDGMDGIVPVTQVSAESEPVLDVRRLSARVARRPGARLADASEAAMPLRSASRVVAQWRLPLMTVMAGTVR